MPECALNLSQAAVYLALAPKSNASYQAIDKAREWVRENGPVHPARAAAVGGLPGREGARARQGL